MSEATSSVATSSEVSSVDNAPVIVNASPVVQYGEKVLSKKEALALPANKGIARRIVEAAILSAHKANATLTAEAGALELGRAARLGHKVVRSVTKSGGIAYRISAKAMSESKESAKDKVARLEAEIAALRASAS